MTFTFHFPHPEDNQPKLPKPDRGVLHIDAIPEHKRHEREALILEAIPLARHGYWELLGPATKEALFSLGLIGTKPFPVAHHTTISCDRLQAIVDALPEETRTYPIRLLAMAVERFGMHAAGTVTAHLQDLLQVCGGIETPRGEELALQIRKLIFTFVEDKHLELKTFSNLLEDVFKSRLDQFILSKNLRTYLTTTDYYAQKEALGILFEIGRHNSPPFLDARPFKREREEARNRAETIVLRCMKYNHSFDRLMCETRRLVPGRPSLLARFGEANFEEAWRLKALDHNRSPGPGFFFNGAKMDSLFFDGRQAARWYASAYQAYGNAFEQLPKVGYLASRLAHVVFCDAPQYWLPVSEEQDGRKELYCALLANDHFTGSFDLAGLFPLKLVRRHIISSLEELQANEEDADVRDVCDPGFNIESLTRDCERAGLPALDLANISVAFGGAVAAYPRGSAPYYSWEPTLPVTSTLWTDARGRVHHAWRARHHDGEGFAKVQLRRKREQLLKPLAEGCRVVADAAEGLLNILDLIMFRYDAFKSGLLPSQLSQSLMLREALDHHRALRETGAKEHEYSCLCLVDRYDWSATPELLLDTHSLKLHLPGGGVRELSSEPSARERIEALWEREVLNHLRTYQDGVHQETQKTLLFLPRHHVVR